MRTERTDAPASRAMPTTLGHTGSMTTMLSPGSAISWMASMMAFIPPVVTVIRSGPIGRALRPVR